MSSNFCRKANKERYTSKAEANSAIFEKRLRSFSGGGRAGLGRVAKHCADCRGFHVTMQGKASGKAARS